MLTGEIVLALIFGVILWSIPVYIVVKFIAWCWRDTTPQAATATPQVRKCTKRRNE